MNDEMPNELESGPAMAPEPAAPPQTALELYKVAFERLTFQDDYLFKFATVFLAVHGALGVLAQAALLDDKGPNVVLLGFTSCVGILLALVWIIWTFHNDYWHSVWIGVLQDIEREHLDVKARVFAANHKALAQRGNRKDCLVFRGHTNAALIPYVIGLAWVVALWLSSPSGEALLQVTVP